MKENKSLFSQLYKKAIFYGLVDEGGWFPQMLASRKTTAEYTKLTKNFLRNQRNLRQKIRVNLCESVSNFPLCLGALVAETQLVRRSLGEGGFLNAMKRSGILFGRLNNEVRRSSAGKAAAFHRSSLREKALPQNACRPKPLCVTCAISVKKQCKSVKSVSNFSLCLGALVAENQSIKTTKLCETNPIFQKVKYL
jgi:hypothetical protein